MKLDQHECRMNDAHQAVMDDVHQEMHRLALVDRENDHPPNYSKTRPNGFYKPYRCWDCGKAHKFGFCPKWECLVCEKKGHLTNFCPYFIHVPPGTVPKPDFRIRCKYCNRHVCYMGSLVWGLKPPGFAEFRMCGLCYDHDHNTVMCPSKIKDNLSCGSDGVLEPDEGHRAFYVKNLPKGETELELFRAFLNGMPSELTSQAVRTHRDPETGQPLGYRGAIEDVLVNTDPDTGGPLGFLLYKKPFQAAQAFEWGKKNGFQCVPYKFYI